MFSDKYDEGIINVALPYININICVELINPLKF